ncbi:MAG: hypothetical protein Kow0068_16660 [Marinilabiliales bacterium]
MKNGSKVFYLLLILFINLFLINKTKGQELITCYDTTYCVFHEDDFYFYFKLTGTVQKTERSNVIQVNEYALNYSYYESDYYNSNEEILDNFLKREKEYFSNQLDSKLDIIKEDYSLDTIGEGIFWYFEMPDEYKTLIQNMLFYSVIIHNNVFVISSTQFSYMTFDEVKQFLNKILNTLTLVEKTYNKNNFCNEIK